MGEWSRPSCARSCLFRHVRPNLVPRQRLIEKLNQGLQLGHKLTLISTPAGFGKTTLISEWVAGCERQAAWLSLEEEDSDPARFLAYLVAALQTITPTIGEDVLPLLQSPKPSPITSVLTTLLNGITSAPDSILLVLDDYHLIDAQAVDDALVFLLDHLPPRMHLVIATREDPDLPIARLRVRGQLTELRALDLRFSSSEAAEFLNRVMGLNLSAQDIAALEARTEGWIAGLQLAAIFMQGHHRDNADLIKSFTGSHRFVLDYLIEEVLSQQPQSVQTFLLHTAVLDRLTGSSCDALTGQDSGQATLEMLERANLFIIPLDNERCWYRYHHLFADLLRQRLLQTHLDLIPKLHLRASEWYEQNEQLPEAIHHALAAKDFEQAADLTQLAWRPMNMRYQAVTWLGWVKAIPDEVIRSRPVLSAGCAWASLDAGDFEAAEIHLQAAEKLMEAALNVEDQVQIMADESDPGQNPRELLLDEEEFRSLSASIANARAYLAQALGDVTGTIEYAQHAENFLREDDYFDRGLAEILPGFAYWASGDLGEAYKAIADAIASMQMSGKIRFVISFTSYLTDIMVAQGRLYEAIKTHLQLLETATGPGEPEVPETAVLHLGLSELYLEQGDSEAAKRHLQRSEALGEQHSFAPWYRHWIYAHSRVLNAQGDLDGVSNMFHEAESLYYRHPIPDIRPLKSLIARAWLAQGKLSEALHSVREQGLSVDDDLSYLLEFEHITLASLLIAQYKGDRLDGTIQDAMELLERLLQLAEEGQRMGSVIEILVLKALAFEAQNNMPFALTSLENALKLAEPEGYFRIFVDEGQPMARLLYDVRKTRNRAGVCASSVGRYLRGRSRPGRHKEISSGSI